MLKDGKDLNCYELSDMKMTNHIPTRTRSRGLSITPSEMEIVVKNKDGLARARKQSYAPSEMEIVVKPSTDHSRVNEAFDEESEKNLQVNSDNTQRRKGF